MSIESYFEQQGSGSPIVFIHGSYATTSTWNKMVEQLAVNHHCISIRLPGHGGTPEPDDFADPTLETELAVLERVVTGLTDEPVHLVGHSYGGVVALAQALKGNLPVSEMTLFEPVAVWVLDTVRDKEMRDRVDKFMAKYRHDVSRKVPYCCGQVIEFWGGEGTFEPLPDFIKDGMESLVLNNIRHWDICQSIHSRRADLQECKIPTRLVCGDQSNPVAHAISNHILNEMPNSRKYVIEGASHFLVTSHPKECLSALQNTSIFQ